MLLLLIVVKRYQKQDITKSKQIYIDDNTFFHETYLEARHEEDLMSMK